MTEPKTFDVTYPGAVAGVVTAGTSMDTKSLEQMVRDAVGAMGATSTVRPDGVACGNVPTTRD